MKMMKRVLSIVLALAMVVTVISINPTEANAKVTIQSGKKINLTIGKTEKIYVKQKGATFKTSNKKVATVSKKGVVGAAGSAACAVGGFLDAGRRGCAGDGIGGGQPARYPKAAEGDPAEAERRQ